MKLFTFICCILLSLSVISSAATVYKKVNKDGSIEYSDKPFKGANELVLKDLSQQTSLPTKPKSNNSLSSPVKKKVPHHITILKPVDGATIRSNQGEFSVLTQTKIKSKSGHKTQLIINNAAYGKPSTASLFQVKDLPRGELKIKAQLTSHSGQILATSKEITVYLHKAQVKRAN